jgi:Domain of unknown function (DUF6602)
MSQSEYASLRAYRGYVERLSKRVHTRLAFLEAMYNFDLGQEFEVAVCHLLSEILPSKYGVCRGFVVSSDGEIAGDDVIIFDSLHFPTLRGSLGASFALKDQVPIEAVYAYIECKHSVNGDIFRTAALQTSAVNADYEADGPIYAGRVRDWPRYWPPRKDQPFTMIMARNYEEGTATHPDSRYPPDLSILGDDYVMTQRVAMGADGIKGGLFFDDKHWAKLEVDHLPGIAFGAGLLLLMQAIGWIGLPQPDWASCLNETFWRSLEHRVPK